MNIDMSMVIEGVTLDEIRSISPDTDSKKQGIKKNVHLYMKYDGLTLGDVFTKAFKSDCVSWQNGSGGRANFDNIENGQVIKVNAARPGGKVQVDAKTQMIMDAKADGIDTNDKVAFSNWLKERFNI